MDVDHVIRDEVAREGIISVARFMELALYQPDLGYYRRQDRTRFGRGGDFYTAEQLQPLFGDLIAAYATKLASAATDGEPFSILEIGAGNGDMRSALGRWNYRGFDWTGDALPEAMHGLVLANEFFDALPVHLLIRTEEAWQELGVLLRQGQLAIGTMRGTTSPALIEYARRYAPAVPEGTHLEVCTEAAEWLARLSRLHQSGTLLIFDYGYSARELIRFPQGTIMAYRNHVASEDFLSRPGGQDITAHVNFSYLTDVAVQHGYRLEADLPLERWLRRVWTEKEFESLWRAKDGRWRLQWKQLSAGMGETFRVLELTRRQRPR